jgi:3-isopropylmalate/(R)-2-methylmalate dehydratase large subunit
MGKTLTEKLFEAHIADEPNPGTFALNVDLAMCHEITTPPAILDIAERWGDKVWDPQKIVAMIDHVNPAMDSATALQGKVMRDWARRHGIRFFDVGRNGVCHALLPEQGFVLPGMLIVCGDSHTCTHGAFGALAFGIGTTDLEAVLLRGVVFLKKPKTMRVELSLNGPSGGKLPLGVFAKDVILFLISQIGVKGATDHIIEFTGPIIRQMDMDGRMTICNMAVEAGATSGICEPDEATFDYYRTINHDIALSAFRMRTEKWHADPDAEYDLVKTFDLSNIEPQIAVGNSPGNVKPVREMAGTEVNQIYIGSCTNGRLSDLRIAAQIFRGKQVANSVRVIVVPATTKIQRQAIEEGLAEIFIEAGACFSNPTCGACLGMSTGVLAEGEVCLSTTNRNFPNRMGKGGTVYLASPATAAATALRGVITDPREVR